MLCRSGSDINRPLIFVLSFFSSCMCPTLFHNLITVRETLSVIREDKSPGTKKNKIKSVKRKEEKGEKNGDAKR